MNDLLKEAKDRLIILNNNCNGIDGQLQSDSYEAVKSALDHYEELLKKEEGVKPTEYFESYCVRYHCLRCNATIETTSIDKKNMFKPNYCHACGTKIDWSDT